MHFYQYSFSSFGYEEHPEHNYFYIPRLFLVATIIILLHINEKKLLQACGLYIFLFVLIRTISMGYFLKKHFSYTKNERSGRLLNIIFFHLVADFSGLKAKE